MQYENNMKFKSFKIIGVLFVIAFALTFSLSVMSSCSSASDTDEYKLVEDGKLKVAMSLDYPPFESMDGETPVGFDVVVIQEVANRLGLSCEIANVGLQGIVPAVQKGEKYDVGISALSINSDDEAKVDFTSSYYIAEQAIVVLDGSYNNAEDLQDLPVAAQPGTTSYFYARDSVSNKVVPHSNLQDCFAELQAGTVKAVVIEYQVAKTLLANGYTNCEILEKVATSEEYGIAVNKDNHALIDAINEALASMEDDGTLEALRAQYLAL